MLPIVAVPNCAEVASAILIAGETPASSVDAFIAAAEKLARFPPILIVLLLTVPPTSNSPSAPEMLTVRPLGLLIAPVT